MAGAEEKGAPPPLLPLAPAPSARPFPVPAPGLCPPRPGRARRVRRAARRVRKRRTPALLSFPLPPPPSHPDRPRG